MVDCTLDQVWRQYEIEHRRDISIKEVSEKTGLTRDTISNMRNGKTARFDAHVIAALAEFFEFEPGQPVPFLVVREVEYDKEKTAQE